MKPLPQAAWLLVGRLGGDALAFGLFILVARVFGPVGTGSYFFTFAIATIFYEIVSLGIEEYGVREYARGAPVARRELLGRLAGAQFSLGLATALAVLLGGTVAGDIDVPLLACMLAYQLAFAVSRTLFIPAFVAGRVALQVLAEIATRAAVLALAILVIAIRPSGVSLIESLLGLPVFGAALLIAALVCARRFAGPLRLVLRAGALRPALASIWPFAAANVLSGIYTRTAILVLFFAAGSIEAGLFASAWKFTELSWALLILVPWAGYPALARLFQRNDAHFRALADRVFAVTVLCGGAFAWGTYWVVPALAERTLGAEFAGSGLILQVMAGFVALAAVNEFLERIALVAGLQMMRLKILTGQTVLNVILTFVLVPRYGMLGAAVALVASQAVTIPALLAAVQPCMQARAAARTLGIYALALGGAASLTALPAQAISTWAAAALSLLTFASIMHAGGALRLARAGAAWRSAEAWGR